MDTAATLYARDAVGNEDQIPAERTFTVDTTAPTVTSVTPSNGALKVSRTSNVMTIFSEAIEPATLVDPATLANNFTLVSKKGKTASLVPATITLSSTADGKTVVTLDP